MIVICTIITIAINENGKIKMKFCKILAGDAGGKMNQILPINKKIDLSINEHHSFVLLQYFLLENLIVPFENRVVNSKETNLIQNSRLKLVKIKPIKHTQKILAVDF